MTAQHMITIATAAILGTMLISTGASASPSGEIGFRSDLRSRASAPIARPMQLAGSATATRVAISTAGTSHGVTERRLHRWRHGTHLGDFRGHLGAPGLR